MWEPDQIGAAQLRFNSQRSAAPKESANLVGKITDSKELARVLKAVARWCTEKQQGRTHIEWGCDADRLWLFQLDFEDDAPDVGVDPLALLRETDASPTGDPPPDSPFRAALSGGRTGWGKIDKVSDFLPGRSDPYPPLFFATGDAIRRTLKEGRDLSGDIEVIVTDRGVCRTDCKNSSISRLNLPRTHTVSSDEAVTFMRATLDLLEAEGVAPEQICFILHKFIPARAAAWAAADPGGQIVLVDALWGLPDGLQYLPHDTFEFDLKRQDISAEQIRYKPQFLQEMPDGTWSLVRVARGMTRSRCLSLNDLRQVATETRALAKRLNKAIQVMWFCDVAEEANVGRNVPWFMMDADVRRAGDQTLEVGPRAPKVTIRTLGDIKEFHDSEKVDCILRLEPDAELFRDDNFVNSVIEVAKKRGCKIELAGSILGHAFYVLDRSGLPVITSTLRRSRVRQRKIFGKLVRDEVPERIREQGERVLLAQIPKSEARLALIIKMMEECQELLAAESPQEVTGELADVLEVVRSLCLATGTDWNVVLNAAEEKRKRRGSFERNVVLLETSWPGWARKPETNEVPIATVKSLAHIASDEGGRHFLPFGAVLPADALNIIQLSDGTRISVRFTTSGMEIREVIEDVPHDDPQLNFDFE